MKKRDALTVTFVRYAVKTAAVFAEMTKEKKKAWIMRILYLRTVYRLEKQEMIDWIKIHTNLNRQCNGKAGE